MATLEYQTPPPGRSPWRVALLIGGCVLLVLAFVGLLRFSGPFWRTNKSVSPRPTISTLVPTTMPAASQPSATLPSQ